MALESPASYPSTLTQFLTHWEAVDEYLGAPLVVREGGRAVGLGLAGELETAMRGVQAGLQGATVARELLVDGKLELRGRMDQFAASVRGLWRGTGWTKLLSLQPRGGAALDKFLRPCREAGRLWAVLEGEADAPGGPGPLLIGPAPGMGRAAFLAAVEGVRLLGLGLEEAEWGLRVARTRRNAVMRRVRALLQSYTRLLPGRLPEGHALLDSLPRLWPLPGRTPLPVRVAGGWLPGEKVARLTWSESRDEALEHYEVRGCAGTVYEREDEMVLGTVPRGGVREFMSGQWLSDAGAAAVFRVYVVLRTGNARASGVVEVRHPLEGEAEG